MDDDRRERLATELAELNAMMTALGVALSVMVTAHYPAEELAARDLAERLETDVARRLRLFAPWTRRGVMQG